MYCHICGQEIKDDQYYCDKCGTLVRDIQPDENLPINKNKTKKISIWIYVFSALTFIYTAYTIILIATIKPTGEGIYFGIFMNQGLWKVIELVAAFFLLVAGLGIMSLNKMAYQLYEFMLGIISLDLLLSGGRIVYSMLKEISHFSSSVARIYTQSAINQMVSSYWQDVIKIGLIYLVAIIIVGVLISIFEKQKIYFEQ